MNEAYSDQIKINEIAKREGAFSNVGLQSSTPGKNGPGRLCAKHPEDKGRLGMKSSEHDLELTRRYLDGDATREEVTELGNEDANRSPIEGRLSTLCPD